MTYREAIEKGEEILNRAGIGESKTDAWLLASRVCGIDRTFYYTHTEESISAEQLEHYIRVIRKRAERVPLQYITGEQEFMGLVFHVNSSVLIPRQDTETLVEEALKRLEPGMRILDLCTGSGCVLISILKNAPSVEGIGSDLSKQALIVAKENARLNGVAAVFERSDLLDQIAGKFDMIVSNPPYIRTEEILHLMPEVSQFEPLMALDGKEDGLYYYRRIIEKAAEHLNPGGKILFEIGYDQGEDVSAMLRQAGFSGVEVLRDLTSRNRVVLGKRPRTDAE